MTDEPQYTNKLINEKSPYLLQHAHNPVDWHPWGQDAFDLAAAEDKPIFLSIGYATCHWCHVMEREVFEDPDLGKRMNDAFVNIKVDREELPDVDALYMELAQSMLGGAAGWPLNLVLTPDLEPFYAATYLPARAQYGLIGMVDLIERIDSLWKSDQRPQVMEQARELVEELSTAQESAGDELTAQKEVTMTVGLIYRALDPVYGGIKGAPKFPIAYQNSLLLRYFRETQDARALFCVERTLEMMARGGIHDHLGGGFSRYSVDERWQVPHFEKMLYDNALLAEAYLELWRTSRHKWARKVCEGILDYVLRDMTNENGGFYSAEDADSEGREGLFYSWTPQEVEKILGPAESGLFCDFYSMTNEGNFEGRNVLFQELSIAEYAEKNQLDEKSLAEQLDSMRARLWKERENRAHPLKDDKVLVSWNGLMIHSLALAGAAFGEGRYTSAAIKAAEFIQNQLWKEGRLFRRWREGEARFDAGLEEYAFLIRGLLTLYQTTADEEWLSWALTLQAEVEDLFRAEGGGYFQTTGKDPSILVRQLSFLDGAEPSGNAVAIENLLRLYQLTFDQSYIEVVEEVLKAFEVNREEESVGHCYNMLALQRYYNDEASTLVISLCKAQAMKDDLVQLVFSSAHPHTEVLWMQEGSTSLKDLPSAKDKEALNGKTTVYLCRKGYCMPPYNTWEDIKDVINEC